MKSVVEGAGGELRSTQILPATPLEGDLGFRRATLRVRFVVTIEGLETTLYELETGQPYLIIDYVGRVPYPARRGGGGAAPGAP